MRKNIILTIVSVAAFIIAAVTMNSCSKQDMDGQTQNRQTTEQPQMTTEDHQVYNSIMNFKKKVDYIKENPGYKSGETISIDSAQWYLDATFNFTYSFIFESFVGFHTDSVFFDVPVNGGLLSLDDVGVAYFEMYDKHYEIYENIPGENKDLYISTTQIKDVSATSVTFKSTATFGERGAPPEEQPFVEGDNWMWGELAGLCPQSDPLEDAATKIAGATMLYRNLYMQDIGDGWHAFYTDPSHTVYAFAENELWREENPLDNYHDYLMFYAHKDNCPPPPPVITIEDFMCIEWEDMNWYYFGMNDIIYTIIPDNPEIWPDVQGKTFTDISMAGNKNSDINGIIDLYHEANITYRTRWIIAEDDYPLPF
ncbi:MAG: hypothetical protein K8S16_19015 [Bacteroidales bacterium]|nr:hypothetical protein [Bacteroidales bacterium]